jgi:thioredoxin-related protein
MNDTIVFGGYTYVNMGGRNGRKGTHQLAAALLQGKMSYPSYVLMSEKNQLITVVPGYLEAKDFLPILKYIADDVYLLESYQDYLKKI